MSGLPGACTETGIEISGKAIPSANAVFSGAVSFPMAWYSPTVFKSIPEKSHSTTAVKLVPFSV